MIKIVTSQEMRQMDRYTIETLGIPGVVLMENAGRGVYLVIEKLIEQVDDPCVYLFCGKGNNGGDGFVIARYLWEKGVEVHVFVAGDARDLKGDAKINFDVIRNLKLPIKFLKQKADLKKISSHKPHLIVDALLGTGITGAVHGFMMEVISFINRMDCAVVAVDVPSGLNSDLPAIESETIQADITVTMALPKICHVFYPAKENVGDLYIADIGIPPEVKSSPDVRIQMIEKSDIFLPHRPENAHKYSCGKVAVLAGSAGYSGAATLTSEAAMRMGAGLVMLGIPEDLNPILEMKLTEVITRPYAGSQLNNAQDPVIQELLNWCDVLAIGPGLGRSSATLQAVIQILQKIRKPVVIDADALFALSHYPETLKKPRPNWVLTPHHGEFLRLLENTVKTKFEQQFVSLSGQYAQDHGLNLLLKGAPSLVAAPDGQIYVNPTGNSGLASGGTGDVLTGFVAALLAQGMEPGAAAITANYIHGKCADDLVMEGSEYSLLASDLFLSLDRVLHDHLTT
ncbi:MAG: NAD(P)H-hydrate dehydratase [bacterium]|nr:MAG: NAD(P)H-hydrate dehydratase [bacterium]